MRYPHILIKDVAACDVVINILEADNGQVRLKPSLNFKSGAKLVLGEYSGSVGDSLSVEGLKADLVSESGR